uniref:Peptidase M60 domain-containing protein n=1 Tax=Periophthalmus magnuspinnatus TaxID=409849 RepID=A0A3B4A4H8_9GOBI
MHAGYPVMAHCGPAQSIASVEDIKFKPIWGIIHELGHNQQRRCWEFPPHMTECTCNLWSLYVYETVIGFPREQIFHVCRSRLWTADYVKKGRDLKDWNTFVPLETYVQLVETSGWDSIKTFFAAYHKMTNVPKDNRGKMNLYCVTFSETVGMNLTGFFKAWGWPIEGATERRLSNLLDSVTFVSPHMR